MHFSLSFIYKRRHHFRSVFKKRIMAKYYPDIAKGAKGTRESSFFDWFACAARGATESAISLSLLLFFFFLNVGVVDLFWLSLSLITNNKKRRFIHRRLVVRKQILLGREANLRRGAFLLSSFIYSLLFFAFYSLLSLITREKREKDREREDGFSLSFFPKTWFLALERLAFLSLFFVGRKRLTARA